MTFMVLTKVVFMDRLRADSCFVTAQESAHNLFIKMKLVATSKKNKVSFFSGQVHIFVFIYKHGIQYFFSSNPENF